MTIHRKRLIAAGAVAVLLVCGAPGAVLAQGNTDVTLWNESEGSEVNTGESHFRNFANEVVRNDPSPSAGNSSSSSVTTSNSTGESHNTQTSTQLADLLTMILNAEEDLTPEEEAALNDALRTTFNQIEQLFVGLAEDFHGEIIP